MTIDEYKELMKFNILLSDIDLEGYKYAAVDDDGEVWVYTHMPRIGASKVEWELTDTEVSKGADYEAVCVMESYDDWQDTLIEL